MGALPWSGYIHVFFDFGVTILSNLCVKRVDIFAALDHIFGVPVFGFFLFFFFFKLGFKATWAGSMCWWGVHQPRLFRVTFGYLPGVHLLYRTSSR